MTDDELYDYLKEYYAVRDAHHKMEVTKKEMHVRLMAEAVERGMHQRTAIQGQSRDWLDGYLMGSGFYAEQTRAKYRAGMLEPES